MVYNYADDGATPCLLSDSIRGVIRNRADRAPSVASARSDTSRADAPNPLTRRRRAIAATSATGAAISSSVSKDRNTPAAASPATGRWLGKVRNSDVTETKTITIAPNQVPHARTRAVNRTRCIDRV